MAKYRAKLITDGVKSKYIIQQRFLGFLWCDVNVCKCDYLSALHECVNVWSRDYILSVSDKNIACDIIKWLSLDEKNLCFIDSYTSDIIFAFSIYHVINIYKASKSLEGALRLKKLHNIESKKVTTSHLYYNNKKDNFYIK